MLLDRLYMELSPRNLQSPCSVCYTIFLTVISCYFVSSTAVNNETDRISLLDLKAKFHDPLGVMNSWNDTVHFCQWYGVTCERSHQRVTALNLQSSQLGGRISPFIGNLSFLTDLELYNNSLVGEIPSEIGQLHRLQYLLLHNNSLQGQIPSNLSACSNLIQLRVPNNKLVGGIPSELGFLQNLQFLSLDNNRLSGSIPQSLGNLSSLSKLSVTGTDLVGSIPDSLGKLENLSILSFFNNDLSGFVPPSIFNLSQLVALDLGFNHFEGNLPSNLGINLPNLQILYAGNNDFTGSIPASIFNSSSLEQLQLNDIGLTGKVPSLQNLPNLLLLDIGGNLLGSGSADDLSFISFSSNVTLLETFSIGDNKFGGSFPEALCNFSSIRNLKMGYNKVFGHLLPCIGDLVNLQIFSARVNQLSGVIPPQFGKLQNLGALLLRGNQLSGFIPCSLGNLTLLTLLDLSENKLQGHIPSTLGNCKNLLALSFYLNNLSGSIPPQLLSLLPSVYELILSRNHFTGSLPTEVGSLKNLVHLDISDNMISGEIPSSISGCFGLQMIFMERNLLQGVIPSSLSSLRGLQYLDLSDNNLSGNIPEFLASFPLQMLNLSYNSFEGEVPVNGSFSNSSIVFLLGNRGLCGGISELKLPLCNFKKTRNHRQRLVIAALSGSLGAIMVLAFVLALVYIFLPKRIPQQNSTCSENLLTNLSYQTLLKATNGFCEANLIGSGTYGSVYKGILNPDGTIVAVKVLHLEQCGALKSFVAECEALRNVRHRNLIKVITACSSVDYQGNDFKAVVYEFMVNGSLEDWLHPTQIKTDQGDKLAPGNLSLCERLDIAVHIAFALEYLHHSCLPPIVHCDLKPSNVLLDGQMVAHIGDFGLAKFLSDGHLDADSNRSSSSTRAIGTIGYACPEYGLGNEVSIHGDVYSFGILVLEMFTGKKPTDDTFTEGWSLRSFVEAGLPDRVTELLDPVLLRDSTIICNAVTLEVLITVFRIGLFCSADIPRERLDMRDAAAKLSSIREKLLI